MTASHPAISADDVAVTLAVREELGAANEPAVIAEFLDRVGRDIDARVDARVAEKAKAPRRRHGSSIPFYSLIFGIPITAISTSQGLPGMLVAWGGIAAINIADALRR